MSDKDESYYKRHDTRHILDKLDRLVKSQPLCNLTCKIPMCANSNAVKFSKKL